MEIFIIILLVLINGIFSMSEIALVSARKSRLESAKKRGNKSARAALDLANSPNKFLSTVQIGITLIGILTGIYSGQSITNTLQLWLERFSWLAPYAQTVAVTLVLIFITFLSLILGELVPKRIGLANPEKIATTVATPMTIISKIVSPFVWLLTSTTDIIIKIFRIKPSSDSKITEEEIKAIVQEGTESGEVQEIEQDILHRVFNLGDRKVSSLMTHRSDVVLIDSNDGAEKVKEIVNREIHSIYPVYEHDRYNVIGIIRLKDLFLHINDAGFKVADYIHPPHYIPENTPAYKALETFKGSGRQHGIITDEYGQMQGFITVKDLLTALVGTAEDFYLEDYTIMVRDDGTWLIDGDYPWHDFLHYFDIEDLNENFDFNTIGGLIIHELERIPVQGDKIQWQGFMFEVMDMDGARIDKILLTKTS